jgi:hypothetical protein
MGNPVEKRPDAQHPPLSHHALSRSRPKVDTLSGERKDEEPGVRACYAPSKLLSSQ